MADERIAVIGAGVIGCAIAFQLAERGLAVTLIDRAPPAQGGASFGNVGHIAAELVEPLPSPSLLYRFVRELTLFGGPLAMPITRWPQLAPWALAFACAAFRRHEHTQALAPLVRPASADFLRLLTRIERTDLLRQNGHYQIWTGPKAAALAAAEALAQTQLGIPTRAAPAELLAQLATRTARPGTRVAALHFPDSGHVLDPAHVAMALADAACARGAEIRQAEVLTLEPGADAIGVRTSAGRIDFARVVVAAGVWSSPLLRPFGLRAPLEAAYGYHLELPAAEPVVDAPLLYSEQRLLVTPMAGRLRASSFMEFSGIDSPEQPDRYRRLQVLLRQTGYPADQVGARWRGPRPVLPDYLPGLGRAPESPLYYAIGHQHIGLTLAPITAELIADLILGERPKHALGAFDLRRFGRLR